MTIVDRPSDESKEFRADAAEAALRARKLRVPAAFRQDRCAESADRFGSRQLASADRSGEIAQVLGPPLRIHRSGDGAKLAEHAPAGQIPLLDLNPDLVETLSPSELQAVRRAWRVPLVSVQRGWCDLDHCSAVEEPHGQLLGAVVVEGLLIGETRLADQVSAQLFGPGDLLNACPEPDSSVAEVHALFATAPTLLALLDDRYLAATRHWPRLAGRFLTQALRQADRAYQHHAIAQLTRVEDRLLAVFAHLADRFGRVGRDGVLIDLPLTHEIIGHLVGARRPTVSLGVKGLVAKGLLNRRSDGTWVLTRSAHPPSGLASPDGWASLNVPV